MTLHLYETQQEEKSKPIRYYLILYKKDLPFDIVELMEDTEKKVKTQGETLCRQSQPVQTFVGRGGTGCPSLPKFLLWTNPSFGVHVYPTQKDIHFPSSLRHSLLGSGTLCHLAGCPLVTEACSVVPFSTTVRCGNTPTEIHASCLNKCGVPCSFL